MLRILDLTLCLQYVLVFILCSYGLNSVVPCFPSSYYVVNVIKDGDTMFPCFELCGYLIYTCFSVIPSFRTM